MPPHSLPTHADIAAFFQRYLPISTNAREVPFLFHSPRNAHYDPSRQYVTTVVLSIAPTPGFYTANSNKNSKHVPVSFLHRPWNLDRRALPRGSLVLSSHASFDEHLTVGWNVALAERLKLNVANVVCIKGYKDNPDRKIGLVARLEQPQTLKDLSMKLREEYQGIGDVHVPEKVMIEGEKDGPTIETVAIMNAFHKEEIARVLEVARNESWIGSEEDGRSLLYLTGAARDYGLEGIKEVNMPAYCVGHRACEEWGIRYLANQLRMEWPNVDVVEVLEEEEIVEKKLSKSTVKQTQGENVASEIPHSTA